MISEKTFEKCGFELWQVNELVLKDIDTETANLCIGQFTLVTEGQSQNPRFKCMVLKRVSGDNNRILFELVKLEPKEI